MKASGSDVHINAEGGKVFKSISLEKYDFAWFELLWQLPLTGEFSAYKHILYGINAQDEKFYKIKHRNKLANCAKNICITQRKFSEVQRYKSQLFVLEGPNLLRIGIERQEH